MASKLTLKSLNERIDQLEKRLSKLEPKKKKGGNPENKEIWDHWSRCFEIKYKAEPVRNASINGMIQTLRQRCGVQDAKAAITMYLRDNDRFLVQNRHHLRFLVSKCESYVVAAKTNRNVTRSEAEKTEKSKGTEQAIFDYLNEEETTNEL